MARICVINLIPEEIGPLFTRYAREVSAKVWRADTELGIKSPQPGLQSLASMSLYFELLNRREIVEKAIEAEREGYDAVVIHCFGDPGVRAARSVLNIPVIGSCESSLALACNYGSKIGIVTMSEPFLAKEIAENVRLYGFQERAIPNPVRSISIPWQEWLRMGPEEAVEKAIPDVVGRARECIADGADVIVIGCTMIGPICTMAGLSKVPDTDVPILDCLAVALKTAEMIVDFNAKLGLPSVGRTGIYAKHREKDFNRNRVAFGLKAY